MIWTIMPFVDLWDSYTHRAALDVLEQTEPTRLLLINNGSGDEDREKAERFAAERHPRVLLWSHDPQLPALNECWNRALDFCWKVGAEKVWVCNNDARFSKHTLMTLSQAMDDTGALFVSAVGVGEGQFDPAEVPCYGKEEWDSLLQHRGGPDFSCFLISKEGHKKYRLDPNLTYAGDCDLHRQYMLGGDAKRIFSVNVPYLHYASRTINRSEEALEAHHRVNRRHLEYYEKKWGGRPNQETFRHPFAGDATNMDMGEEGITNPELQARG